MLDVVLEERVSLSETNKVGEDIPGREVLWAELCFFHFTG